jgi:hypothetical protein
MRRLKLGFSFLGGAVLLMAGSLGLAMGRVNCDTFPAGPARTDCYIGHGVSAQLNGKASLVIFTTVGIRERIHLPQVTAAQELQIKAEARLAPLMEEKLVTEFLFYPPGLEAAKRPSDFLSAFRLKRTKRHRTSIKRPPTKRKIGLSRR